MLLHEGILQVGHFTSLNRRTGPIVQQNIHHEVATKRM